MSVKTPSVLTKPLLDEITACAFEQGFDHLKATTPGIPFSDRKAYLDWVGDNNGAGMVYMTDNPSMRTEMEQAYPSTRSVLTLGVSYYQGPWPEKPGAAFGKVARYAWGLDYHDVIRARLKIFLSSLEGILGTNTQATLAIDTKPLLEKALARKAGLGFVGKNTILIIPKTEGHFHVGSFVFLMEILMDVPLEVGVESAPKMTGCGSCTKCLTACPTKAFKDAYTLDSGKCIAYLTIENKGWVPRDIRPALSDWVFGCDICQDVCPFNSSAYDTRWPEFRADRGVGPWVSLKEILSVPDQPSFKKKWGGDAIQPPQAQRAHSKRLYRGGQFR